MGSIFLSCLCRFVNFFIFSFALFVILFPLKLVVEHDINCCYFSPLCYLGPTAAVSFTGVVDTVDVEDVVVVGGAEAET